MKCLNFQIAFVLAIVGLTSTVNGQNNYTVHECSGGHCAIINFHQHQDTEKSMLLNEWTEPIKVSVGVQEGVMVDTNAIIAAIAEDSDIAIDEGVYTGSGPAYILTNIFSFSPDELTNLGLPFSMSAVNVSFSTLDAAAIFDTIYDSYVLQNRDCYGTHKTILIVDDSTPGVQEIANINATISASNNPTETFKKTAFLGTGGYKTRNHAITHSAGGNSGSHQDGPEVSRRPIQTSDGKSFGWSTTGSLGYSGGIALGIGPNGENLAGHIADGHAEWLTILPNLSANMLSAPNELDVNQTGTFEASINKDIGNESWEWTFTNGGNIVSQSGNPVNVSFSEAGTWTYQVVVANDCGGQSDTLTGTFIVNQTTSATYIKNDERISVYPNPSSNLINIETDNLIEINKIIVYNQSGKLIMQSDNVKQLSLQGLPNGQYQLNVVTSKEVFSMTIIKNE